MKYIGLALALMFGSGVVQAETDAVTPPVVDKAQVIESRLVAAFGPRLQVREVAELAQGQILEVILIDGSVMHMTPDMSHFLYRDELYQLSETGPLNITQNRQTPKRAAQLAAVADEDTVVFPAEGEQKALINVFTDIDCGYCQKLHQEIPKLNELGITVRYLAYPRAGVKNPQTGQLTDSYRKINYVWCQEDRKEAMTTMKNSQRELSILGQRLRQGSSSVENQYQTLMGQMGEMIGSSKDCGAPIASQFALGRTVGVTGTPAIVTEDGMLYPGYLPAEEMARRIGL